MSEAVLHIGGNKFSGWNEITINRGRDVVASSFSFSVVDKWEEGMEPRPINEGDDCVVKIDGIPVVGGYIDRVNPAFDGNSHSFSVVGRSRTCDLVDCAADFSPGQWRNIKFSKLIALLCKPFGITKVSLETNIDPVLPLVSLQPGETVWELIERTQKMIGVVLNDDYVGGVVIREPTKIIRADVALVQGKNLVAGSGVRSWEQRFSQYRVRGQLYGDDLLGAEGSAVTSDAIVYDRNVKRYRPTVIIGEGAMNQKDCKTRASFAMTVAAGKSDTASATVKGWIQNPNAKTPRLWDSNILVPVYSPWLKMDGRELMVSRVTLTKGEGGELSVLELAPVEAFRVMPELKEKNGWSQLLKDTK